MRKQGKTQEEVGKILEVPQQTISRWEKGSNTHVSKASIPDMRIMVPRKERSEIYKILGVPQETISDWENTSNTDAGKAYIPDLRNTVQKYSLFNT